MVVSLLWAGGATSSTASSIHTVGTYPAAPYGTNPLVVQVVAGLATQPNGSSLVESGRWGPSNLILGTHYRNSGSPAAAHTGPSPNFFADHFMSLNASIEDEGHAGYLDPGGSTIFTGDAVAQLAAVTFILHVDDVILDGLGAVPPSIDGQSFAGSTGAIVGYFPNPIPGFGGGETWSFHSLSGVIGNQSTLFTSFPALTNTGREVWPFAFAVVFGHSNDTPPYATPDLVNGLPSWSMVGFQQINNYFVAVALWVPADPSNPDYSFNFSGFPTSDWGSIGIYTLNFPPLPPTHPYAVIIG